MKQAILAKILRVLFVCNLLVYIFSLSICFAAEGEKNSALNQTLNNSSEKSSYNDNSYMSDDEYFDFLYLMYDNQENKPYYTGLTEAEANEHNNKKPKTSQANKTSECKDDDDDCRDAHDRQYGTEMQDGQDFTDEDIDLNLSFINFDNNKKYFNNSNKLFAANKPINNGVVSDVLNADTNNQIQQNITEQEVLEDLTIDDEKSSDSQPLNNNQDTQNSDLQNNKTNNEFDKLKIAIDGNFELASTDLPSQIHLESNLGKSDKFARNMQTRSSAFIDLDFAHKVNEDITASFNSQFDVGSNAEYDEDESVNLNKLFFKLAVKDGSTTELGITKFAGENLRVDASSFAKGSGGINGDIFRMISQSYSSLNASINSGSSNASNPAFIVVPRSPFASGFANSAFLGGDSSFNINNGNTKLGYGDDFASFSYYTKRFGKKDGIGGLKFGLSFAPNTEDAQSKKASKVYSNKFTVTNAYSAAINYYKSFANNNGSFVLTLSQEGGRVGLQNKPTNTNTNLARNDINISTAGLNIEYLGFIFGSSYSHWGKSMYYNDGSLINSVANTAGNDSVKGNSYYFTNGIGYSNGPVGASLGMIKSKFMGNSFSNYVLSTQYDISSIEAIKIKHFVELARFSFNPYNGQYVNLQKTNGYVIMTGFRFEI